MKRNIPHQLDTHIESLKFNIDEYKKPQLSMLPFMPMYDMWLETLKFRGDKLIERIMQRAHSPLRNWANTILAYFSHTDQTVVDRNATTQTVRGYSASVYCNSGTVVKGIDLSLMAGDDDDSYGLLAGKGQTPVTVDDYDLASPYIQGTNINQLDYGAVNVTLTVGGTVTIDTTTYTTMLLAIERPVTNAYTDNQTIYEVGLVVYFKHHDVGSFKYLIFRDLLDTPITLAPSESATLRYHLRWLLPA